MKKIKFVEVSKSSTVSSMWSIKDENGNFYSQLFWTKEEAVKMMDILNSIPAPKEI